ncbi:DNA repair protein endonuclease SAE2/CtIP C-terminus-domain-containing protein [Pseudomassariella vexata]|uniref:DNA repair protein endonuclease SAE2/CtIP C-terminus-domain-containing protein n=1 Tax=Pseudomassariella vexata TaxID=1141098 RepID=A0A1Y2E146_9PEZI|nr:DNA repair protein endonuclease SAE2/CtIP C-terminus-domain-containing protein [Pseudomassariella vexata]ORY65281.1 DNA repair protein endonuclease SAE2/CtIP C-terminus-domain-containing protein [Pseudomassariella vexata]
MDDWFTQHSTPALLNALKEVCGQLEEHYREAAQAEAHSRELLEAELDVLRLKAANVDRLQEQNKALKDEVAQLRRSNRSLQNAQQKQGSPSKSRPPSSRDTRSPLTPVPVNEVSSLRRSVKQDHPDVETLARPELLIEYKKLDEKYEKLRETQSFAVKSNNQLQELLRNRKKECDKWVEHAETLGSQIQSLRQKNKKLKEISERSTRNVSGDSSFTSETHSSHGDPHGALDGSLQRAAPQPATKTTEWPIATSRNSVDQALTSDNNDDMRATYNGTAGTPKVRVGNTTHTDFSDAAEVEDTITLPPLSRTSNVSRHSPVKNEPSSDAPVIVSERPVRKRKHNDKPVAQGPPVTKIKTEHSSDPVVTDEQYHFAPQESVDFDDAEDRVSTPRKTRMKHPKSGTEEQLNRTHACRFNGGHARSILENADLPSPLSALPSGLNSPLRRSRANQVVTKDIQKSDTKYPGPPHVEQRKMNPDNSDEFSRSTVLQPLDANTPLARSLLRKPKFKTAVASSIRQGIESLAEDGERLGCSKPATPLTKGTGRLETLLNVASPGRQSLPTGGRDEDTSATQPFHFALPQRRDLPLGKESRNKVSEALEVSEDFRTSEPKRTSTEIQPKAKAPEAQKKKPAQESTPLRERAVKDLKLTDFKVNPNRNNGYDFAFTDVVRSKGDRIHMLGCVKETCCGPSFRKLAEAQLPDTGILEYTSLLEDWLGDDARRLSTMSKKEKDELWLKAKTQDLSNRYGKHRDRYHPQPSPPGFWDTDFPSTQELAESREKTEEMEQRIVKERRREAMRPAGLWVFRDE